MGRPTVWASTPSKRDCREKIDQIWLSHRTKVGKQVFKEAGKKTGVVASLTASIVVYDVGPELIDQYGAEAITYGHDAVEILEKFPF